MIETNKFNIKTIKSTAKYGKFELSPLVGGFGHTLGNSLRRVLLITIPGAAITRIRVDGATHLFTTLPGVKEDLVEISLNLKKVKFNYSKEEPIVLKLDKKGPGVVTAGDIVDNDLCRVANPDQIIATLSDAKSSLKMEMTVERGVGYTMAKEQKTDIIGEIILDATFTPVLKSNYTVEPTRLGKKSNYDKLTMEIWTDGSIDALYALKMAAKDLINAFGQIADPKDFEEEIITINTSLSPQGSDISVEEIELPLRVTNALKKAGYNTIDNLVKSGRLEVSKAKNVGEKSLKIIDSWLKEKGFSWK
ncbi:MAG TPA: DNA-directed RNA polymerase subunit alpha [Candidatus Woesebacteria bacterium]|jgi:DNA-directed RNA polymerase subunit alpha|nr:DNA-directed RNA polymerase subunit alpha [Candidatus Shapirobacteria bacterium]HOR01833.1 DNA-directed RNA polymerase subunit alpha [Candidatus Woesebacteria bacterium]